MISNLCGWSSDSQCINNDRANIIISPPSFYNKLYHEQNNVYKVSVKNGDSTKKDRKIMLTHLNPNPNLQYHIQPSYQISETQTTTNNGSHFLPHNPNILFMTNSSLLESKVEPVLVGRRRNHSRVKRWKDEGDFLQGLEQELGYGEGKGSLGRGQLQYQIEQYSPGQQNIGRSYSQLLKQNTQLKRIIQQQYRPLKKLYDKLKQEHLDRQYLISQLEWKIRELGKAIKEKNKI